MIKKEWFDTWFDSPYYHILCRNRGDVEARDFIDKIKEELTFTPDHKILDLACGRGRHAIYMNSQGFHVEGVDLSKESIAFAKKYENDRLYFKIHDMREVYKENSFDYILNMFTSFGYFDTDEENKKAIVAAASGLKKGGKLVIDFFNTNKVINCLIAESTIRSEGLTFQITRKIDEGTIIKDIKFEANGEHYHYQERVKALSESDFINYFKHAKLKLLKIFGDYCLGDYDKVKSKRMIFVTEK